MISDTLVAAGFSRRSGALVRGLLVLCGVVMLLSAAPAWARQHRTSRLPVRLSTPSLAPASGGGHLIEIAAKSVRGALCQASVSVKDVTQQLVEVKVDRHGRAAWRWTILSTSPSGTWRIRIRCTHGRKSGSATIALLIVTSSSSSTGSIGDPASLETPVGTPAGKGGSTALQCGPFTSTVTQCTCLAYLKRSDIYNAAVAAGVPRGGNRVVGGDGTDYYVWDAEQWLVNAQRAGIPTGSQPVPGAIAVFGTANSAGYGHVQYVEQVASPTSIAVDECNYDWNGSCRYNHWENPEALGEPLQGYIYGGPAGSGPGSGATGPGTGPGGGTGGTSGGGGGPIIGVLNGSNFSVKQGISGQWNLETAGASSIAVADGPDGPVIVTDNGGDVYAKQGVSGQWNLETQGASAVAVADGTDGPIIATDNGGEVYAKQGISGQWNLETQGASTVAVASS